MFTAWLIKRGLSPMLAKLLPYILILIAILVVWWRVDAWGDRRFDQGVEAHRAEVTKAQEELRREAARSATKADDAAARRVEARLTETAEEQERLDDAAENGSSPFDVLFGA